MMKLMILQRYAITFFIRIFRNLLLISAPGFFLPSNELIIEATLPIEVWSIESCKLGKNATLVLVKFCKREIYKALCLK